MWVAFAAIALSPTYADFDLWGHTRFGLDWLATRSLPAVDPYSFTQDRPWINHEWLSEAAMGFAFRLGGSRGLIALKMTIAALVLAVLSRRLRGASALVWSGVLTLALLSAVTIVLTVRPHLWSLLAIVLLMTILDAPGRPGPGRIAGAAILFACWANLHGGWITGMGSLVTWSLVRSVRVPDQARSWIAVVAASLAATLANPYGVGLWRFLASTVRASRPDITEWQPLLEAPPLLWISIAVAVCLLVWLSRHATSRPSLEACAVIVLLTVASLRVMRIVSLLGPATLALLAPAIARRVGDRGRFTVATRAAAVVLAIPLVLAVIVGIGQVRRETACLRVAGQSPDRAAGASLSGLSGRVWTTFDWGEYVIWHAGPALRVSIDGRRETVYSDAVLEWQRAAERGEPAALGRMLALAPEYVWLPVTRTVARAALTARGYRVDVATPESFIAVRHDLPRLPATAIASPPCFP